MRYLSTPWDLQSVRILQSLQKFFFFFFKTSPVKLKWWRCYVDDLNVFINTDDADVFHNHLDSMNTIIQFTVEMPTGQE